MAKKPGKKLPNIENPPVSKPTAPAEKTVNNTTPAGVDFIDKLGNKVWLVALGIIFIMGFLVYKDYLLFDKVYLFKDIGSDTLNGLYPYIYYTADKVGHHSFPFWSYDWGIGQNIFPQLFRDPFDIFLFLAGKDHVKYGLVYKEFAKILLGGITFYYYLKTLKLSSFTALTGSILFAFCGFMIVGGGWSFFSFEAFSMALLLLAFERLLSRNKWGLFPVAIFIISLSTPVNLYVYGIFLALYALLRCFQTGIADLKGIGGLFLKMAGLGLLGIVMCAPFVLENIYTIMESPRGNGTSSYAQILSSSSMYGLPENGYYLANIGTCVMRFFASDILGSGNDFRGCQNILEAPMFYCGIPCLLLMPQVFKFLNKKVRIAFAIFLAIWILPIIFPWLRYAFWLFAGDYYRAYSFLVALVFLYFSMQALDIIISKKQISLVILIVTVVLLMILLNYPYMYKDPATGQYTITSKDAINSPIYTFVTLMLVVYGALLYFMGKATSPFYLKYIFLGCIVVEMIYLSGVSVNQRDAIPAEELAQKTGYNDYSLEAVNFIKKQDNSFYRVDKNYFSSHAMHGSLNDGMVQGFHGTSSYNSFNQGNYINYLQFMGLVDKNNELSTRWALGLIGRPILESENRVKYILATKTLNPLWRFTCDSMGTFGDVRVLKNKYVLPVGFTYGNFIKESVYNPLSISQKDFVSLKACVISDKDVSKIGAMKEFQLKDTVAPNGFTFDYYKQCVDELSKDSLVVSRFDEHEISGKINVPEDKMMYVTIPFDEGWQLAVDGQPAEKMKLSTGMTGVFVKKGHTRWYFLTMRATRAR